MMNWIKDDFWAEAKRSFVYGERVYVPKGQKGVIGSKENGKGGKRLAVKAIRLTEGKRALWRNIKFYLIDSVTKQ